MKQQAFPTFIPDPETDACTHLGMTLKDYIAGKMLEGWMASLPAEASFQEKDYPETARLAYAMAEAMMKEREKHL